MRRAFTLSELMIVVAILSILATVAVPAFVKYMRRAKTVEAIDMLDKIHKGAAGYYARGKVARSSGEPMQCQFPDSIQMTPDVSNQACCTDGPRDTDSDDRCDVDAEQWDNSRWSALSFQMGDQHYFGYTFASAGVLSDSVFTARANADLDCDNILSTFERYGYGSAEASYGDCSMHQASAMYMNLETE